MTVEEMMVPCVNPMPSNLQRGMPEKVDRNPTPNTDTDVFPVDGPNAGASEVMRVVMTVAKDTPLEETERKAL